MRRALVGAAMGMVALAAAGAAAAPDDAAEERAATLAQLQARLARETAEAQQRARATAAAQHGFASLIRHARAAQAE